PGWVRAVQPQVALGARAVVVVLDGHAAASRAVRRPRVNRIQPSAVGATTPTIILISTTATLVTSAVGRKAATRPTSVAQHPTTPAARTATPRRDVLRSATNRYTNGIS